MEYQTPRATIDFKLGEITLKHKGLGDAINISHLWWMPFIGFILYWHHGNLPSLYEAIIRFLTK